MMKLNQRKQCLTANQRITTHNKTLITKLVIDISRLSDADIQKLKDNINIAVISEQWNVNEISFDIVDG
jgi:hypothetical protein